MAVACLKISTDSIDTMNNQTQGQISRPHGVDGEISLVDLVSTLVKRWKLMAAVFLTVVLGTLAFALIMPRTYEYVTIYQVAEQAPSSDSSVVGTLETPQAVVAKINSLYLGPVVREVIETNSIDELTFKISVSSLEDTNLVKLSSKAPLDDRVMVEEAHGMVMNRVQQEQNKLLDRRRRSLEQELASAESGLESVKGSTSENAGELIALYSGRVSSIQTRIGQLDEGQVNQMAVQSLEPADTSRSLIMIIAIVLGGMLSVMVVFLKTFAGAVRDNLGEK